MKKYILNSTNTEVKFGETIRGIKEIETTFGNIEIVKEITITRDNILNLIDKGIIRYIDVPDKKPREYGNDINVDEEKININEDNIGFYIKTLAVRYRKNVKYVIEWLNDTNKICPKAVLDLLLKEISFRFYNMDVEGFDAASVYYSLRPKDGKVGKVTNVNPYIPMFKSIEDAERARKILRKQLELMYGEQE